PARDHVPDGARRAPRAFNASEETPHPTGGLRRASGLGRAHEALPKALPNCPPYRGPPSVAHQSSDHTRPSICPPSVGGRGSAREAQHTAVSGTDGRALASRHLASRHVLGVSSVG